MADGWMTKKELIQDIKKQKLDIRLDDVDSLIDEMADSNKIERQGDFFRISDSYIPKFFEELEIKSKINSNERRLQAVEDKFHEQIPLDNETVSKLSQLGMVDKKRGEINKKGDNFIKNAVSKELSKVQMSPYKTAQEIAKAKGYSVEEAKELLDGLKDTGALEMNEKEGYRLSEKIRNKINNEGLDDKSLDTLTKAGFITDNRAIAKNQEERISNLEKSTERYFPMIRHGYLHLKHRLEEKKHFPREVIDEASKIGFELENYNPVEILHDAHMFEIDPKTVWILKMTDNEIFQRNAPYPDFVIDCDVEIDGIYFKGVLVTSNRWAWTFWGDHDGFNENFMVFDIFNPELNPLEEKFMKLPNKETKQITKSIIKKFKTFVCNFIDFLNNPEVRVVQLARDEKNIQRRIRKGKEVLPPATKIVVTGQLKVYLGQFTKGDFHYDHRFWVRGHYIRYWNKKRYWRLYQQLEQKQLPEEYHADEQIKQGDVIISKWRKPFVKGQGILVENKYELRKK